MITISANSDSCVQIPARAMSKSERTEDIEHVGVSVAKAAAMIGVCERTIWKLAKAGAIRSVRIGTRCIFSVQSIRELVDGKAHLGQEPTENAEDATEP
jgi:hypothetical protein